MPPRAPPAAKEEPKGFDELQFINLTNNYCPDSNSKKVVRQHVMKKYRGEQRKKGKASTVQARPVREIENKLHELPKADKGNRVAKSPKSKTATNTRIIEKAPLNTGLQSPPPSRQAQQTRLLDKDYEEDIEEVVPRNEVQTIPLSKILGTGRVDPLNSLPIKSSPQTAYLIDHFSHFIGWRVKQIPNTFFANFFQFSLTDEAVAHAMMIYAANHNQWTTGKSRQPDIVHHHNEAIKILRSRINSSNPDIRDETIVTIAGLVIFLEMFGSSEMANTHRAGLQRTVELRGGIHELGNKLVSAQFVYGALISPSSVTAWEKHYSHSHTTPYPTPSPSPPPFPINWNAPSTAIPTVSPLTNHLSTCECSAQHAPYPPTSTGYDEIMKETFTRLIDSSSLASSPLHTEHHFPIHNESYLVENRVGTLLEGYETEDRKGKNVKVCYGKSWLLGCRIYLYGVLRCGEGRPVKEDVLRGLVGELRGCLEEEFEGYKDVYEFAEKHGEIAAVAKFREKYYSPNVLLWVLLIAGSFTQPHIQPPTPNSQQSEPTDPQPHEWYSKATADICNGLKISKWAEVKDRMKDLPWVEWKIEEGCKRFWEYSVA